MENFQERQDHIQEPYYTITFDEHGVFENSSNIRQLIIETDTEVHFKLRQGSKICQSPVLLINSPIEDQGTVEYTSTQPRKLIKQEYIDIIQQEDDYKMYIQEGSKLNSQYLERFYPEKQSTESMFLIFKVKFKYSGSFFIQIEYQDKEIEENNYSPAQYINVEPIMILKGQMVRCKELSIISVQSRSLGPIERWTEVFQNISELSYNAVHLIPIQEYGASQSHYSLKDQTMIASYFFGEEAEALNQDRRVKIVKDQMQQMKQEQGLLSIIDIVLNHTANNSEWLLDNPEAAYNTETCPHLYSAWLLDSELTKFSDEFSERKVNECPFAPNISNENDLKCVLNVIQKRIIQSQKLHEFFMFDIQRELEEIRALTSQHYSEDRFIPLIKKAKYNNWSGQDQYQLFETQVEGLGSGPERFSVTFKNQSEIVLYFYNLYKQNAGETQKVLKGFMERHNTDWIKQIEGYMQEAIKNMEGTIRYFKLELKNNKITKENRLQKRYFTQLNNQNKSKVAHNGWIGNAKPFRDFAMEGWHYLRRDINIWEDSIKLRYGNCPADSPFLWNHMSRYVSDMAQIFDGFRLDNAHSTPINACQYLLQVARTANPNLYVMAELFTSSAEADAIFVQKLNFNGLVREIQNTNSARHLGEYFHQLTCRDAVLGSVDKEFEDINGIKYKLLTPTKPSDVIYDCTHDNPPPLEKFQNAIIALSHINLISLSDQAIASTWGYDILLKHKVDVVREKRLYKIYDQNDIFQFDGESIEELRQQKHQIQHNDRGQHQYEEIKEQGNDQWKQNQEHQEKTEFEYEFVFYHDSANKIQVAGDFSNWTPIFNLQKHQNSNKWSMTTELPIIKTQKQYQYKFIINEKDWCCSDKIPQMDDGHGHKNNYIEMGNSKPQEIIQQNIHNSQEYIFQDLRYARKKLNQVHAECTRNNAEIFMHQQNDEVIVVVRQFSFDYDQNYDAYVSITRFNYYNQLDSNNSKPQKVILPGLIHEIVFASYLDIPNNAYNNYNSDPTFIQGIQAQLKVYKNLNKFCNIETIENGRKHQLNFFNMPASFSCVIKTKSSYDLKEAVFSLNKILSINTEILARDLFRNSTLAALNHLLFRCQQEENDITNKKRGPYGFLQKGVLKYAGISSFMYYYKQLKRSQDMGDEIFQNMRDGNWIIDYITERTKPSDIIGNELDQVYTFFNENFKYVKVLPSHLRPKFGSRIIEKVYNAAVKELISFRFQDQFIKNTNDDQFLQKLALGILQVYGRVPSMKFDGHLDTLSAGLPHFSTGYMRCWGRDTFIALKGLMIGTGLEKEAKDTFLFFAKASRHGLIPNLHDQGNNTRFNARDATWFFLQAIKDFIETFKNSDIINFLKTEINLHFKDDNQNVHFQNIKNNKLITIENLIQDILTKHARGIQFREWNAGEKIDQCMKDQGFNVNISFDQEHGFSMGGNQYNCGTWMDKMGSSDKTKNKGIPATPRDGAPIEIVAMQYSILQFLDKLNKSGQYDYSGVQMKQDSQEILLFEDWAAMIKNTFDHCFWIPEHENEDINYQIDKKYINRRGIYKDVYQSSQAFTDYQLRPNVCMAMSYAPDLFSFQHAQICLKNIENILFEKGCMGIKTLDPTNKNYKGDYINSDDSCGWNYHQGPEWLFPFGFFLKAKLHFSYESKEQAMNDIYKKLMPHQNHIISDPWESLPELTNSHGKYCADSCNAQSWSIATILDALRHLYYMEM